jgi:hypothetical protein
MNFLPEKKYGVPSHNFVKKNVLCEKGDEITRFDGIHHIVFILSASKVPRMKRTPQFILL